MLVNEIRKGVYLKWKDNGQIFDVPIGLLLDKYFWRHIEEGDIIPIPITPSMLLKCGFKNENGWQNNWFFNGICSINIHQGKIYYNDLRNAIEIRSLHQLQNLYFSLTNNELNIEL